MSESAAARRRSLNIAFTLYKQVLSPVLHSLSLGGPQGCRYQPTCSEYATLAAAQHGLWRGGLMALWRILRCNPFSRGGWDPVPPARERLSFSRTSCSRTSRTRRPHRRRTGTIEAGGVYTPSSRINRD